MKDVDTAYDYPNNENKCGITKLNKNYKFQICENVDSFNMWCGSEYSSISIQTNSQDLKCNSKREKENSDRKVKQEIEMQKVLDSNKKSVDFVNKFIDFSPFEYENAFQLIPEYRDDILKQWERRKYIFKNLNIFEKLEIITHDQRRCVIDFLISLSIKIKISWKCMFLATCLLDRLLEKKLDLSYENYFVYSIAALFISAKINIQHYPYLENIIEACQYDCEISEIDIYQREISLMEYLDFDINHVTLIDYINVIPNQNNKDTFFFEFIVFLSICSLFSHHLCTKDPEAVALCVHLVSSATNKRSHDYLMKWIEKFEMNELMSIMRDIIKIVNEVMIDKTTYICRIFEHVCSYLGNVSLSFPQLKS